VERAAEGEWWADVIHAFQAHVRDESHFLTAYHEFLDRAEDESIRFLLELILDEERRHHDLFTAMTESAVRQPGSGPLGAPRLAPSEAAALLEPTERFLEAERDDHKRLRALRRTLRPARRDTTWPLIVELMELDTTKHMRILEYLRDRLRDAGHVAR
jgi:rubrerythrin